MSDPQPPRAELERLRAENDGLRAAIRTAEAGLRHLDVLFERAPVACFEVDATGTLTAVNQRFAELVGRDGAALVGSPAGGVLTPELAAALLGPGGGPGSASGELLTSHGMIWARASCTALEADGIRLVALEDISPARKAEQALAMARRRYRGVFLNASDPILLFGTDGRCREANPAARRIFGWGPEDPLPTWGELVGGEGLGRGNSNPTLLAEVTLATREGRRAFELRVSQIDDETWQVVLRDLTDARAAPALEARLRQKEKMDALGRFAGGIVHDLNNVLAATANYAALIADSTSDPRAARDAREILAACTRGKEVTGNLLRFTRGAPDVRARVDLREVVTRAVAVIRHSHPRTIGIDAHVPDRPLVALADGSQLMQVLVNLMLNSVEAMPNGGRMTVVLTAERDAAQLVIADTGRGIPADQLPYVLEPFYTTRPGAAGAGLGLSMAWGVIRSHHGTLQLASEVGVGTTVTIRLPAGAKAGATPVPPRLRSRALSGRVLVVDDDPQYRSGLERLLQAKGLRVEGTGDPNAVVGLWRAASFDALVLDLDMPEKDGVTVLNELLAVDPEARVLIATGYGRERVPDALLRHPGVRYLRKPFLPGELSAALGSLLDAEAGGGAAGA